MKQAITCRYCGGAYLARAKGKGITASLTARPDDAVLRCAAKVMLFPHKDPTPWEMERIRVNKVNDNTWEAEWPDPMIKYEAPPSLFSGWVGPTGLVHVEPFDMRKEIEWLASGSVHKVLRGIEAPNHQAAVDEAERRLQSGAYMLTLAGDRAEKIKKGEI